MIKEMFTSMHDLLDFIIEHYDNADELQQQEFCRLILELKSTSDMVMDHWVSFEEKLALFFEKDEFALEQSELLSLVESDEKEQIDSHMESTLISIDSEFNMQKGQGFYKLFMFEEASRYLELVIEESPECNLARLYYGMAQMHMKNWNEAQRQFQLMVVLSEVPKWVALSYNALGCIQAIKMNLSQAEAFFQKAHQVYPQFEDSLKNLRCCKETPQQLSLYFGSTELCCM